MGWWPRDPCDATRRAGAVGARRSPWSIRLSLAQRRSVSSAGGIGSDRSCGGGGGGGSGGMIGLEAPTITVEGVVYANGGGGGGGCGPQDDSWPSGTPGQAGSTSTGPLFAGTGGAGGKVGGVGAGGLQTMPSRYRASTPSGSVPAVRLPEKIACRASAPTPSAAALPPLEQGSLLTCLAPRRVARCAACSVDHGSRSPRLMRPSHTRRAFGGRVHDARNPPYLAS